MARESSELVETIRVVIIDALESVVADFESCPGTLSVETMRKVAAALRLLESEKQ